VLLVDCDPQGNLTKSLPIDNRVPGVYEFLTGAFVEPQGVEPNVDILGGGVKLSSLEKQLVGEIDGYQRLREALSGEGYQEYDLVLFDTPPSLGMLTLNAMAAAGWVVIPMNPSQYSMQGANDLMNTVSKIKKTFNNELSLLGVVINAVERIPVITQTIRSEIRNAFGSVCFDTEIPKTIRIEEAIASRQAVVSQRGRQWQDLSAQIVSLGNELNQRLLIKAGVL
jgi:chromosome partitioning protein